MTSNAIACDLHCHFFGDRHLGGAREGASHYEHPAPYSLREHAEEMMAKFPDRELVVVNSYMSLFRTDIHVRSSFEELCELRVLYGVRYARLTLLGMCNALQEGAASWVSDERILGARVAVHAAAPEEVRPSLESDDFRALLARLEALGKPLFIYATRFDTLDAILAAVPAPVRVVLDHLGATGSGGAPLAERSKAYRETVLRRLVERGVEHCVIRGPTYRVDTTTEGAVEFVRAALCAGVPASNLVLFGASDRPHVGRSPDGASYAAMLRRMGLDELLVAREGNPLRADLEQSLISDAGHLLADGMEALQRLLGPRARAASFLASARRRWRKAFAERTTIHAPAPTWYEGEDLRLDKGVCHVVRVTPAQGHRRHTTSCFVIGSGYTGVMSLYPSLFAQVLSREGYTCYLVEYPGYGRAGGSPEHVTLAQQSTAFAHAARAARQDFGNGASPMVIGLAWGMGAIGLFEAAAEREAAPLFDAVISANGLLSAPLVHQAILSHMKANPESVEQLKREVEEVRRSQPQVCVDLPPPDYGAFAAYVRAMDDDGIYSAFAGYPLDLETTRVVMRDLVAHGDWNCARMHGAFFRELLGKDVSRLADELGATPVLLLHGRHNKLHSPSHVEEVALRLRSSPERSVAPCKVAMFDARHNDFMSYDDATLEEVCATILDFCTSLTGGRADAEAPAGGVGKELARTGEFPAPRLALAREAAGKEGSAPGETQWGAPRVKRMPTRGAQQARVAVAQMDCLVGDVTVNLAAIREYVASAVARHANLVVFPELALTGYSVRDGFHDVAVRHDSEVVRELCALTTEYEVDMALGLVEETMDHRFFNVSMYFGEGRLIHCHRKIYLPNYGRFDERRFFGAGKSVAAFDTPRFGRVGMLVCGDLWHMELAYALAHDGCSVLLALAASSDEGLLPTVNNREAWLRLLQSYALCLSTYVVFCNRVGKELGFHFYGSSAVISPTGDVLEVASADPSLLVADVDWSCLRMQRITLPFRRDDVLSLTLEMLHAVERRARE